MKLKARSFLFVAFTTACASALSLIGGIGLEAVSDRILPLIPLLIVIPGLNDLVGDYASIIAAHHGDPSESTRTKKQLLSAIFRVVGFNILFLIILSVGLAQARGYILEPVFLLKFAFFIASAVVLAIFIMFALAGALELILKNKNINPDELLIPIITSLADIVMLLFVSLAVIIIF
jgi:cation transporter-like permease